MTTCTAKTIRSLKLPRAVADVYEKIVGITEIFDWQYDCLTSTGVLNGNNLVFSAPTSAGKTLVAELVMIKRILETNKKCIFILPFVSVVREKVHYMRKLFKKLSIRVEGFMGGEQPNGGLAVCDVAICTIEKANSLVNKLISDNNIASLGLIIVDELHMVGDSSRGYLLELLLTKLMFIMKQKNRELCHTQILGMSATLPNLDAVAHWLDAQLYSSDFRPVPLQECLKIDNKLIAKGENGYKVIPKLNLKEIVDEDDLIALCYETVANSHSVLIFCPTKVRCEKLTITIAKGFHFILEQSMESLENSTLLREQRSSFRVTMETTRSQYEHYTKQLKNCPVGLDKLLSDTFHYGVAYHHAGLTFDERDVIEAAFRSGAVRVLIATSTLSSGVNLPARRVIIRTPVFNGSLLDTLSYKQMCGRAGRKGVDEFGQSILICKANEKSKGESLLMSHLKKVESCLDFSSGVTNALKRALLEIIAAGIAKTEKDLELYFESTLLHSSRLLENPNNINSTEFMLSGFQTLKSQNPGDVTIDELYHPVSLCVTYLENYEFIRFSESPLDAEQNLGNDGVVTEDESTNRLLYPTQLGVAALSSSFPPQQSLMVFAELQRARRNFCLDDDLHLIYLVTPLYCHEVSANMEWMNLMTLLEALPSSSKRIAKLIGIEEGFIAKAVRGTINTNSATDRSKIDIHKRFYSALVLLDLINEKPLNEVSAKFSVSRGQLQTLQQSAATFSGMVTVFCHRLGWKNLAMLLSSFQSRLNFGIHQELTELVRISVLNAQRARLLFSAGYHTIVHLANAQAEVIEQVLCNRVPFKSKMSDNDDKMKETTSSANVCSDRGIWVLGAKSALTERQAAEIVISEAKQLVRDDLRLMGINLLSEEAAGEHDVSNSSNLERSKLSRNSLTNDVTNRTRKSVSLIDQSVFRVTSKSPIVDNQTPSESSSMRTRRRRKLCRSTSSSKQDKRVSENNPPVSASKKVSNKGETIGASPSPKRRSLELDNSEHILGVEPIRNISHIKNLSHSIKKVTNKVNEAVNISSFVLSPHVREEQKISPTVSNSSQQIFSHGSILPRAVDAANDISARNENSNLAIPSRRSSNLYQLDSSFKNEDIELSSTPFYSKNSKNDNFSDSISKSGTFYIENNEDLLEHNSLLSQRGLEVSVKRLTLSSQKKFSDVEVTDCINEAEGNANNESEVVFSESLQNILNCEMSGETSCGSAVNKLIVGHVDEKETLSDSRIFYNADPVESAQLFTNSIDNKGNISCFSNPVDVNEHGSLSDDRFLCSSTAETLSLERSLKSQVPFKDSTNTTKSKTQNSVQFFAETKNKDQKIDNKFDETTNSSIAEQVFANDQINSSQDILFEDFHEMPPNQLNSSSFLDSSSSSRLDCNVATVFEPGENSMLLDCEMLTQCLFENVEAKTSFCEEPIEDPVTPQKTMDAKTTECNSRDGDVTYIDVLETEIALKDFIKHVKRSEFISIALYSSQMTDCQNSLDENADQVADQGDVNSCEPPADHLKSISLSFCVSPNSFKVYYLNFNLESSCSKTRKFLINTLSCLFSKSSKCKNLVCFDGKNLVKTISSVFNVDIKRSVFDIGLAWWVVYCEEANVLQSIDLICSAFDSVLPDFNGAELFGKQLWNSFKTSKRSYFSVDGKMNEKICATLAILSSHFHTFIVSKLHEMNLFSYFVDIESKVQLINAVLESNGFYFSIERYLELVKLCTNRCKEIKDLAFLLTEGKEFDLSSPEDVSFMLYFHLKLPPNGDPENLKPSSNFQKVLGLNTSSMKSKRRNGKLKLPPEFNTRTETLMKLKDFHPLPSLIIEYRKVTMTLHKINSVSRIVSDVDSRVRSVCDCLSSTGRMSFREPNIQNIQKTFELINLSSIRSKKSCRKSRKAQFVNIRDLFCAKSDNFVLIGADYSQLELRLLAHFSGDETLLQFLNGGGDVFKSIASVWKDKSVEEISETERHEAKQMCYGIVYGMGAKALSEQLNTTTTEAERFIRSFRMAFPALFDFVNDTISFCQDNGYISTLCNRRRYLPNIINTRRPQLRSHAERQAVNSRIQGSASEVLKMALIAIEDEFNVRGFTTKFSATDEENVDNGRFCVLVLHLHDEVIYEVSKCVQDEVKDIIKSQMESVMKGLLKVKLPVKVKCGASWGQMVEQS